MTPRMEVRSESLARNSDSGVTVPEIKEYSCRISLKFSFLPTHQFQVTCFRLAGPFPVPKPIVNPMDIIKLNTRTMKPNVFFPMETTQSFLLIRRSR